jgi:hypothetical protein
MTKSDPCFQARADVVDSDIGGDRALLHMGKNTYFTLNPTAAELWLALSEPRTLDQLVGVITEKFEVTDDVCRPDIAQILDEMVTAEVVDRVPG